MQDTTEKGNIETMKQEVQQSFCLKTSPLWTWNTQKQAQDVLVPAIDGDSEVSIIGLAEEASLWSMSFFFGPA